jgi:membrane protease YdiL (CAAX protease family)
VSRGSDRVRPARRGRGKLFAIVALALAVGLATAVAPFASSSPDGLERVAADEGFAAAGEASDGPLADYAFPGVENERLATGLAGFVGALGVFAIGYGLALAIRRRRRVWT